METQRSQGKLVVLFPAPLQGHMSPMLLLATQLHSRGLSIIIAHSKFNSPNPSLYPNFIFQPLPDNTTGNYIGENLLSVLTSYNLNCRTPFQEFLTRLMQEQGTNNNKVLCIIFDSFMNFAQAVADDLNIPTIMLRTSSALTLLAYNTMPQLYAEGYLPLQDSRKLDLAPGLNHLRSKDVDFGIGTPEDTLKLCKMFSSIRTSAAIVLNTNDYLEHFAVSQLTKYYQVPIFLVGPLHKMTPTVFDSLLEVDTSCISWLNKQAPRSILFVSLGSVLTMNEKELVEMACGLANSNQPFLWVVRPGMVDGSEWIQLLPKGFKEIVGERGHIVKWAPQREVLAHHAVGGFWTHCGWNSTLESICEGVPVICRPCKADQNINARYLCHEWKVGIEFNVDFDRREIERAIRALMQDNEGKEMRQRATDMKERLYLSTLQDGSSYSSLNDLTEFISSLSCRKQHITI